MKLHELLKGVCSPQLENIEINRISSNSKEEIVDGTLFVCLKGARFDAHDIAQELTQRGAAVLITERDCKTDNQIIVEDTRIALSRIWSNWYGNPERKMKFIGVTGTNGKTTVTTVIKRFLDMTGHKAGLIGTCQNEIGGKVLETERTTPEPCEFFALLRNMADEGCEYVVMEVSSQGLSQKRLGDVFFETAVFTNLTQDHLDVHGSMENYYQAKKLLFSRCRKALINIDDPYGIRCLSEISCPKYSFSIKDEADYTAQGIRLSPSGTDFWYSDDEKTFEIRSSLPGSYNVSNMTAAIAALELCGISPNETAAMADRIKGVRGRCESVPTGRDFTVILDYAHTPDAIVNILRNVREYAKGRVVLLFGCGGNRDAKKRPLMAKAAMEYADFLVVTSDNPRDENPGDIITDIIAGFDSGFSDYIVIEDRKEAIFWAVKNARKDDVIVLAGKGHEDYQILSGGVKIHFDERETVMQALSEL